MLSLHPSRGPCRPSPEGDTRQFPAVRQLETPTLTTLHRRLDLAEYVQLFRRFRDVPIVSISVTQNAPRPTPGSYLAFLGRISPEKGTASEHLASYRLGGLHLPRVVA